MTCPLLPTTLAALALGAGLNAQNPPIPEDTELETTPSGLYYSVLQSGDASGESPKLVDTVRVHYTGWLLDGTVFDSSRQRGEPSSFEVGNVISGWTEGLQLMKPGDRFKFTISPDLAYGPMGSPPLIPADSTLIFDVELLDVIRLPEFKAGRPYAQTTTDSGLKYEVLVEGTGAKPESTDIVDLKFAFWTEAGRLIQCTEKDNITIKFALDGEAPLKFLSEAAQLMKIGDRLRLEVPPELGSGNLRSVWELELAGVSKPIPVPEFAELDEDKVTKTLNGLEYEVVEEGTGKSPTAFNSVTVHYAGWLPDGTLFDSSHGRGEPSTFPLNGVIRGWTEGVQLMKEGAVYRFRIPSGLAYGLPCAPPKIGPDATLIFLIELVKVN